MNKDIPQSITGESNGKERRRSARLNSPPTQVNVDKMEPVKPSIAVKKTTARKTVLPSEHDKENAVSMSGCNSQKISTPGPDEVPPPTKDTLPSPILASSAEDLVWSKKVRRSYSRLSDQSFDSIGSCDVMFGFENLKTPEVVRKRVRPYSTVDVSGSSPGGDDCLIFPEPDPNIPGVAVVKEKRKRRKRIEQINVAELESYAAMMNAEFEEAEGFQLVVE
ncbi:sororin [Lampris incognitus]|uniref:sororin n=1 Tax=Lampris incognitus TaxID=2546036 RepID=UPI0024B4F0CC|nr:sororin [Lampris incognitus]